MYPKNRKWGPSNFSFQYNFYCLVYDSQRILFVYFHKMKMFFFFWRPFLWWIIKNRTLSERVTKGGRQVTDMWYNLIFFVTIREHDCKNRHKILFWNRRKKCHKYFTRTALWVEIVKTHNETPTSTKRRPKEERKEPRKVLAVHFQQYMAFVWQIQLTPLMKVELNYQWHLSATFGPPIFCG